MVYRENNGYGDANHVLYQILKHSDDDTRKKMESRLKSMMKRNLMNIKNLKKDGIK